jgi:hypothetical protein
MRGRARAHIQVHVQIRATFSGTVPTPGRVVSVKLVDLPGQGDALRRRGLTGRPGEVVRGERAVEVHPDDEDVPAGRVAQRAEDLRHVTLDGGDPASDALLADDPGGDAAVHVVSADVDRDQRGCLR